MSELAKQRPNLFVTTKQVFPKVTKVQELRRFGQNKSTVSKFQRPFFQSQRILFVFLLGFSFQPSSKSHRHPAHCFPTLREVVTCVGLAKVDAFKKRSLMFDPLASRSLFHGYFEGRPPKMWSLLLFLGVPFLPSSKKLKQGPPKK